jgi:hypothetical protein
MGKILRKKCQNIFGSGLSAAGIDIRIFINNCSCQFAIDATKDENSGVYKPFSWEYSEHQPLSYLCPVAKTS